MLKGRPSDLTAKDVESLVDEQVQEGDQCEFKERLPSKNREGDPWQQGCDHVGDRARNEIVEEVVAFANAYGGWLLLGVQESGDKPARADSLSPLRKCHDLAERLRLMCRDCIEPQLPVFEVAGIKTNDAGDGLVAFYVPRSRAGPHRHTVTRECYVRRADRSEKLTMREIQDLTLNLERGIDAVSKTLEDRRKAFEARLETFFKEKEDQDYYFGMRITAMPVSPVYIECVHKVEAVQPPLAPIGANFRGGQVVLRPPMIQLIWKPILRGTQGRGCDDYRNPAREIEIELTKEGLLEYKVLTQEREGWRGCNFYLGEFMALVANAFLGVERIRRVSGAPGIEYVVEVEVWPGGNEIRKGSACIVDYDDNRVRGIFPAKADDLSRIQWPRLSLGSREEFQKLAATIEQDFLDAVGIESQTLIQADFETALGNLPEQVTQ